LPFAGCAGDDLSLLCAAAAVFKAQDLAAFTGVILAINLLYSGQRCHVAYPGVPQGHLDRVMKFKPSSMPMDHAVDNNHNKTPSIRCGSIRNPF
jgi:hypothetical protein